MLFTFIYYIYKYECFILYRGYIVIKIGYSLVC